MNLNTVAPLVDQDKANHFFYGAIVFWLVANVLGAFSQPWAKQAAFLAAIFVALMREYVWGTGSPDPLDIMWTVAGAVTVWTG